MASSYTPTNDTTNAVRVNLLINGPCRHLFRDILREDVPDIQLPEILDSNKLEKRLQRAKLNKSQKDILYPPNGRFTASYDSLDLSLLYTLIRNISKRKPHGNGWGNFPDPSDRSFSANVDRIREIRNKYCGHATSFTLSDTEFSQIWDELTVIITELQTTIKGGCTIYTDTSKLLKTVDMDPQRSAKYLQKINKQQQTIQDLKGIDDLVAGLIEKQKAMQREQYELRSKQSEHEGRIARLENNSKEEMLIKENTKAILKTHAESKVYFKTSSVQATIANLKEHGVVILSGKCGEGKTTTAYQVMHELSTDDEPPREPIIITEADQWYKAVNPKDRLVVYLEDIFGSTNLDVRAVDQWRKTFDAIFASVVNGNVLVIIGIRESILTEAMEGFNHKLFQKAFEINLSSEKYYLTDSEKREMIERFENEMISNQTYKSNVQQVKEIQRCKLNENEIAKLIKTDPFYGFPLTCYQFFSNPEFRQLGYEFFNHPDKTLFSTIEKKRKSELFLERLSYALLACVLVNGKLKPEIQGTDELLQRVCHELEIDVNKIKPHKIKDALKEIKGSFLKQTSVKDEYIFSHEAVLEAVLVSFGEIAPVLVIGDCNMRKIHELVRTKDSSASEIVLKIVKTNFIHLAERLLRGDAIDGIDRKDWNIAEHIICHPATADPEFVDVLLRSVESAKLSKILPRLWNVIPGSKYSAVLAKLLELYGPHNISTGEKVSKSKQTGANPFQLTLENLKTFLAQCVNNFAGKENTLCCVNYILKHEVLHFLVKEEFQYSPRDMTLLHCCILLGWDEVVDSILKIIQKPMETRNKWTCAHFASYIGNAMLLKKFVQIGVDLQTRTEENYSILQCAFIGMRYGSGETNWPLYSVMEHLSFQMTLCFPNEGEYYELLQFLFERCPALFEGNIGCTVDEFKNGILHYLIIQDYFEILEFLCSNDKDLALDHNTSGLPTTVHLAVYLGRPQILRALWTDGVRPDQKELSLQNTFDFGEKLKNKTVKFSWLNAKSKWCWNDGEIEISDVKITILADVDVVFGREKQYNELKFFLGSQDILKI